MVKVNRPASTNIDDIRSGSLSPDERQKRNREQDDLWVNRTLRDLRAPYEVPKPRPDPRSPMPGGKLALGKGQSRQEFRDQIADDVWIAKAAQELATKYYHTKFLGVFGLAPREQLKGMGSSTWVRTGKDFGGANEDAAKFLLDTFKRARSVGFPIHPLNEQPEPLPMSFKYDPKQGIMMVPWEGDGWMPAANEIKAGGFNQLPATYASQKVHTYPQMEDLKELFDTKNDNKRIRVVK